MTMSNLGGWDTDAGPNPVSQSQTCRQSCSTASSDITGHLNDDGEDGGGDDDVDDDDDGDDEDWLSSLKQLTAYSSPG